MRLGGGDGVVAVNRVFPKSATRARGLKKQPKPQVMARVLLNEAAMDAGGCG